MRGSTQATLPILAAVCLAAGCAHKAPQAPAAAVSAGTATAGFDTVHVAPPTGEREADRASILAALERVPPGGTVQFAAGTYLVGEAIPVPTPRITLLGHPEGTTLRGCSEAELDELEREADRESDLPALFAVLLRCGIMELTGGHVTVRDFTFENTRMGLLLGCCHAELAFRPSEGGYRIENNTFRDSGNAIHALLSSPEPTVIRGNRFINVFHALSAGASHLRMLDNDISVPEPERVAGRGHPGFGIGIWPIPGDFADLAASGGQPCEHNLIAGNRIEGHETGIVLFGEPGLACRQNVIRDNTIIVRRVPFDPARWPADAVGVTDPADSTIVGVPLTLHNPSGEGRIEDNLIEGNQILGAEGIGIEVLRASKNRIVNNTITDVRRRDPFPGNTLGGDPQRWAIANGSGIWVSPGSEENEIRGNTFEDIASHAVVLEGDRNRVDGRGGSDTVHGLGRDNRVTAPADATQQITNLEAELAAIVREHQGDNDRFGVLFARFDGDSLVVQASGDIRPDDHLRLGSVSKVFLGFIFLREGPSPDATIAAFYPTDRYPHADAITARMLLGHTSGIPDEMGRRLREFGPDADPAEVLRALQPILAAPAPHPDERVAAIYDHETGLDFAPGSLWCYSNPGYIMLGRMIERSTGQPIERLLARHFGEVAPSLYLDDGREASFPASYPRPWPIHWSQPWVAGALIATAADAVAALHHIARQPEFQVMQEWVTSPRCPADIVAGDDYGLGLQRYVFDGIGEAVGHDGHIIARSLLFRLDGTSYLIHTTRSVGNAELRAIAERLLAAQR